MMFIYLLADGFVYMLAAGERVFGMFAQLHLL